MLIRINRSLSLKSIANIIITIVVVMFMAFWLSACSASPSTTVSEQTDSAVSDNQSDIKESGIQETDLPQSNIVIDAFDYQDCVYPPEEYIQACTAQGGKFSQQGMLGCHTCVVNYDDAGTSCKDSTDCQGRCESSGEYVDSGTPNQRGQCSLDSSPFGCHQEIEGGVAGQAVCVD